MASTVIAFKQAVNKGAATALDQRVGIAQLQQPVPEAATSKGTGTAAYLLKRNPWNPKRKEQMVGKHEIAPFKHDEIADEDSHDSDINGISCGARQNQ